MNIIFLAEHTCSVSFPFRFSITVSSLFYLTKRSSLSPDPISLAEMSKTTPSQQESEILPFFEGFKKFKRLRLFEPSVGVLGFFFVTVCVVCCFFYLDYRAAAKGFLFSSQSERFIWFRFGGLSEDRRVEFLSEEGDACDVFDGSWVWDESYPLYESKNCSFMDDGFRCSENGRPDLFYTKWRWQPKFCNLPRFNATLMLESLRNKRIAFVGDSIGRNQWESLLCMLSSVIPNKASIYEVNGSPITKHKGFLLFMFKDFNCTVEYYRAPFLVLQSRPPAGASRKIRTTLKLDQMDWSSMKWGDADVLVFNTGHWWNYEKTIRGGCYFQVGKEVKMDMKVEDAYQMSIETVVNYIHSKLDTSKTQVYFRTYAPVHFRGGSWKTGGTCHLETLPELGSSLVPPENWSQFKTVTGVISARTNGTEVLKLDLLNVTEMSSRRKDGHSSRYYLPDPAPIHRQDCSHWCLPGVPDAWNELLFALFLKHTNAWLSNSSEPMTES